MTIMQKTSPIRSIQMQPPLLLTPRLYFRRNQKPSLPASRTFLVVILPFFVLRYSSGKHMKLVPAETPISLY
ncbi:hypothetical protein ACN42_g9618 [Penicillium freii]|uniref:Uncharacterized protein n=1 Tax=Penicillium freii TaxID=48697 RepID=A0A101MBM7_PENFR|nr:hypothetical protein ACN42_g9618 [Penicillium freii]